MQCASGKQPCNAASRKLTPWPLLMVRLKQWLFSPEFLPWWASSPPRQGHSAQLPSLANGLFRFFSGSEAIDLMIWLASETSLAMDFHGFSWIPDGFSWILIGFNNRGWFIQKILQKILWGILAKCNQVTYGRPLRHPWSHVGKWMNYYGTYSTCYCKEICLYFAQSQSVPRYPSAKGC